MTTAAAIFFQSGQVLFDQNGCPVRGGSLSFYDAETTSSRPVYRDALLTQAHTSPVKTDYYGRIPAIWIDVGNYKIVAADQNAAQLYTIDDLPGGTTVTPPSTMTQPIQTGMVLPAHTTDAFDGWLFLNGRTISNSSGGGSARANADTQALFVKLWNQDESLTVTPSGRGVNAAADFVAGKSITLPDYRGRVVAGVDQMSGDALAEVLTALTTPTPDTIGTDVGAESVTLSQAQLPAVAPIITVNAGGGHTPTATAANAGSHNHTGSTNTTGSHQHPYVRSQNQNQVVQAGGATSNNGIVNSSTDAAGDHAHTISTDGDHTHTISVAAVPDHTHTATSSKLGSGQAQLNVQPAILVYWLIKL